MKKLLKIIFQRIDQSNAHAKFMPKVYSSRMTDKILTDIVIKSKTAVL